MENDWNLDIVQLWNYLNVLINKTELMRTIRFPRVRIRDLPSDRCDSYCAGEPNVPSLHFLFCMWQSWHIEWAFTISTVLSLCNIPALTLCSDYKPQSVSGLAAFMLEGKKWVKNDLPKNFNTHCIKQTQNLLVLSNSTTWWSSKHIWPIFAVEWGEWCGFEVLSI